MRIPIQKFTSCVSVVAAETFAPLAGEAAYAAGTRGPCPLDSRWGFTPDP